MINFMNPTLFANDSLQLFSEIGSIFSVLGTLKAIGQINNVTKPVQVYSIVELISKRGPQAVRDRPLTTRQQP